MGDKVMPSIGSLLGFFSSYAGGVVQHTEDAHPKSVMFLTVLLASLVAVLLIHLLPLVGLVTLDSTVVKRYGSALDLVFDDVVGTAQFLGDLVNRPAELEKYFYFVTFFAQKEYTNFVKRIWRI
jgi:hypothetical protein